ncbi:hypothetical protein L211DRAFT_521421 [Terfezia boudieri ATCC MYA-4762]|uniref:Uncharacterized protein n=1 Tax=Terfezia boudieri ATCC MYA-4762 TaxID=1051890 RepID=A0A3N4LCQ7_9PEZI|nr:hypothetical protein L211DRAFT_521421 [Terfezia boudieri ATCC MYA-4762]
MELAQIFLACFHLSCVITRTEIVSIIGFHPVIFPAIANVYVYVTRPNLGHLDSTLPLHFWGEPGGWFGQGS